MGSRHGHSHGHALGHNHSHHSGDESCAHSHTGNIKKLTFASILIGLFMVVEVIGGVISGSLALLADAGHMLTDFAALMLALGAFKLGQKPKNNRFSFGYDRFSVLAAFVNALTLIAISVWIVIEAIRRFFMPGEILTGPMLGVAIIGLAVNIIVFFILIGGQRDNLNMRGAILHVIGDMLGSVAAILAALIIMLTGWLPIDPLLSLLVAGLILRTAWPLLKESGHILLETTPARLNPEDIAADLRDHIVGWGALKDMHIWSISSEHSVMTIRVSIINMEDQAAIIEAIKIRLKNNFQIGEAIIEITPPDAQS